MTFVMGGVLTLAPGSDRIPVELLQILTQYAICRLPAVFFSQTSPLVFQSWKALCNPLPRLSSLRKQEPLILSMDLHVWAEGGTNSSHGIRWGNLIEQS